MKQIKCLDCEVVFQAETAEGLMMGDMMKHYKKAHAEIMAKGTEEERKAWMEKFHKDWEAAEEV